jgi:hypothetical protein
MIALKERWLALARRAADGVRERESDDGRLEAALERETGCCFGLGDGMGSPRSSVRLLVTGARWGGGG